MSLTDFKKHLTNPAILIGIGAIILSGVTSYNQIGDNTALIKSEETNRINSQDVISRRLEKKILIINNLQERVGILELELASRNSIIQEHEELVKELHELELEVSTLKVHLEYINNKLVYEK